MLSLDGLTVPLLSAVASASIRAAVLAAIAALLLRALQKPSAPVQHAVWTVVTITMFALPVVTGLLPPVPLPRVIQRAGWPDIARVRLAPVMSAPHRIHRTEPVVLQINGSERVTGNIASGSWPLVRWPAVAAALYVSGVLTVLLRLGGGLFLAGRLLAQSTTLRNTRANEVLQEVASHQQLPFPWPRVYESGAVAVPVVVGGQGPAVVLPSHWREWDQWKLRAVLAHELTHLRRSDSLLLLLAALNQAVFWFHPLAWWLPKQLSALCEQASDDAAVLMTGDPVRYARVVLDLATDATAAGGRLLTPVAGLSIAGATNVSRRIDRLLAAFTWSSGVCTSRSWLIVTLVSLPLVTLLAAAQLPPQPSAKPAGDVAPGWAWASDGFSTTADQARGLEERLAREPDDLAARAKLIAYYLYNANTNAVAPHAMWVIEHHPESELAGSPPVTGGYFDPTAADDARRRQIQANQLWLRQAALHDRDTRVIGNAGAALIMTAPAEAERLLLRARELDRANGKWLGHLTRLYSEAVTTDSYQTFGVVRFGGMQRFDSGFAARARGELDRSPDVELVGSVGSALANFVAHTVESQAGQDGQIAQARHAVSEYASSLLKRALADQLARAEWAEALRLLENPSMGANGRPASVHWPAESTNSSDEPSASRFQIPPAQQRELLVSSSPPEYPPLARQARIQGVVRFRVRIGTDGRVAAIVLVHGHPLLVASAEKSVRTYVYTPTLLNGQPVEVETLVDVNFSLSGQP